MGGERGRCKRGEVLTCGCCGVNMEWGVNRGWCRGGGGGGGGQQVGVSGAERRKLNQGE